MISENEILKEIQQIRLKTEILANPLYNDAGGSTFWTDIDNKLKNIEYTIKDEISKLNNNI